VTPAENAYISRKVSIVADLATQNAEIRIIVVSHIVGASGCIEELSIEGEL
jgi:hypothetical protein